MNEPNASLFVKLLREGKVSKEELYKLIPKIMESKKTFFEFINHVITIYGRVNFYRKVKEELCDFQSHYSLCSSIQYALRDILRFDWDLNGNYNFDIWDISLKSSLKIGYELFHECFREFIHEKPINKSLGDYWWRCTKLSPRIECVNRIIKKLEDKGE